MPRIAIVGLSAVLAVMLVAAGGWYFLIRGDEPPPVSLADAITSSVGGTTVVPSASLIEGSTGSSSTTPSEATSTAPLATSAGTSEADGDLAGTWVVDSGSSFVGYRIDEELSGVGSTTAVGRTAAVEGSLTFDGAGITGVEVTADLTQLESDDSRRDGQLRRQSLETNTYPEATFVLAEPISIPGDPADGQPVTATAIGDLTLHGVANRVSLALEGQYVDGAVVVVGSTVIALADYEIDPPSSMLVLSVADQAVMEMQLIFRRG